MNLPDPEENLPTFSLRETRGRTYVTTGNHWEQSFGYCRGMRVGGRIELTGTLGLEADGTMHPNVERQAARAFAILSGALEALGGELHDVVRVTGYLANVNHLDTVGGVFRDVFNGTGNTPCFTQVAVAALAGGGLIEIEMAAESV